MSRNSIYLVIFLALSSLLGVIVTQIHWVRQAYRIEEKAFNDRVIQTMNLVVADILTINRDSGLVKPVEQISDNFFVANINDTLHPYLLETLLKEKFSYANLTDEFEYGIYDCFNDSIVFGSRINFDAPNVKAIPEGISITKRFDKDGHYFGIFYPNKGTIVWRQMDVWIYSSLMTFLVVIFFAYLVLIVLRQKKVSEIKTDFINNMTHELKTPISTISLSAEVLLRKNIAEDPDRLHQYAQIIQNENNRLKTQVEKVLQIATLSPEKVNIKNEAINIHEVIEKAIKTYRVTIQQMDGIIQSELLAENPNISGDVVHINNIIYNLLDNACKYTHDSPRIFVKTANINNKLQIEISDEGLGIAPEYQKMIFDKFFRVPTGNLHDVKGFGLGLFYVKTIIEAHHGKIWLESKPNKGSIFTIQFNTI